MSTILKYLLRLNVTITKMSLQRIIHQKWSVTKTEMSPTLKFHQNWNVARTYFYQNLNVGLTKISPKLIFTENQMSPNMKCHQTWNVTETEMSCKQKFQKKTEISPKLKR